MRFQLTPRSMTLDDFELLQGRILSEFRGVSQIWEAITAKLLTVNSYCQRQRCNPLNRHFKIMFLALICSRFLRASYTHCCRALTLALARLSCLGVPAVYRHMCCRTCLLWLLQEDGHVTSGVCNTPNISSHHSLYFNINPLTPTVTIWVQL